MTSAKTVLCTNGIGEPAYVRDIAGKRRVFVRFGALPTDGVSRNHRDGGHEPGVSVFAAYWDGDGYLLDCRGQDLTSALFIVGTAYLVTGREVGRGSDGEPCLAGCKARRLPEARANFGYIVRDHAEVGE